MTMLSMNGMRQPQTRNWSPEIALNTNTAGRNEAAVAVGTRPFHRQQHRAAPFAADPDPLDKADDRQDDGPPDANCFVGRDKAYREGCQSSRQKGGDQRPLAPDAVAEMPEKRRPDRPGDKADRIDREGLQHPYQRVGFGEEEL
jgi:hypothetical protein